MIETIALVAFLQSLILTLKLLTVVISRNWSWIGETSYPCSPLPNINMCMTYIHTCLLPIQYNVNRNPWKKTKMLMLTVWQVLPNVSLLDRSCYWQWTHLSALNFHLYQLTMSSCVFFYGWRETQFHIRWYNYTTHTKKRENWLWRKYLSMGMFSTENKGNLWGNRVQFWDRMLVWFTYSACCYIPTLFILVLSMTNLLANAQLNCVSIACHSKKFRGSSSTSSIFFHMLSLSEHSKIIENRIYVGGFFTR